MLSAKNMKKKLIFHVFFHYFIISRHLFYLLSSSFVCISPLTASYVSICCQQYMEILEILNCTLYIAVQTTFTIFLYLQRWDKNFWISLLLRWKKSPPLHMDLFRNYSTQSDVHQCSWRALHVWDHTELKHPVYSYCYCFTYYTHKLKMKMFPDLSIKISFDQKGPLPTIGPRLPSP